ncbi:MAG: hypothetical protein KAJ19_13655 [Gammaproteobacteria bacterium]|nr:hypothetical protein [Gammaproteobacteria bacterium]
MSQAIAALAVITASRILRMAADWSALGGAHTSTVSANARLSTSTARVAIALFVASVSDSIALPFESAPAAQSTGEGARRIAGGLIIGRGHAYGRHRDTHVSAAWPPG